MQADSFGNITPSIKQIAKKHDTSVDLIKQQLRKGIQIEFEHTNDKSMASEIARDHLAEFPDYYDRLEKVEEDSFGLDNLDNSLKDTKFTVSVFKHEVSGAEDRNKKIKWQEAVAPVKDVKSGLYYQDAVKLSRTLEKHLSRDNSRFKHGWVDYFTHIKKDDFNEAGGTVGFMFRGGYNAGMKSSVSKSPRKTKSFSPIGNKTDPDRTQKPQKVHKVAKASIGGRVNQKKNMSEKYNTNSTFIKVGKNLVELIKNKVTRRIKKGDNITENDIISHKVFVDGPEVGYIDEINDRYYVKDDDGLHTSYDTIEEAISIVMGQTYYDGKGTSDFGASYYNNAI